MTNPITTFTPITSLQIVPDGEAYALALDGYVLVDGLGLERAQSIQADYEIRGASAIMESFE